MIRTGSPGRNNFFLFCEIFLLAGFFSGRVLLRGYRIAGFTGKKRWLFSGSFCIVQGCDSDK